MFLSAVLGYICALRDTLGGHLQWYCQLSACAKVCSLTSLCLGYEAFLGGFKPDKFITSYIGVLLYVVNIVFWKVYKRTTRVGPWEASLSPTDEEGKGTGLPMAEPVNILRLTLYDQEAQNLTKIAPENVVDIV